MNRFSGTEPGIGSFDCRLTDIGGDWCLYITPLNGERIEQYFSTWQNEPCHGLSRVYAVLREHGFNMAGYQSAEILNFKE